MSALQQIGEGYREAARRRFPYTPAGRIRGTGFFALVFKCNRMWTVNLYPTAEERDTAWEQYESRACGAVHCVHDHAKVNL